MKTDKEAGYMAILAALVLSAAFYLGYLLLTNSVLESNKDIVNVALGLIGTIVGYYFGSLKSSSDKTDIFRDNNGVAEDIKFNKEGDIEG